MFVLLKKHFRRKHFSVSIAGFCDTPRRGTSVLRKPANGLAGSTNPTEQDGDALIEGHKVLCELIDCREHPPIAVLSSVH